MPTKKRTAPAPDLADTGSDSIIRKPEKKKLQPFLDSGEAVEDTELESVGFNPIPPTNVVDP